MLQIEATHINPTNSNSPEEDAEAMEIKMMAKSIVTGEARKEWFSGHIFMLPTPPPTNFGGAAGNFLSGEDICLTTIEEGSKAMVEFPDGHFCKTTVAAGSPFFVYVNSKETNDMDIIAELNQEELWGAYFKLPDSILMSMFDEDSGTQGNDLFPCAYMRVGKLTDASGAYPAGTYVGIP